MSEKTITRKQFEDGVVTVTDQYYFTKEGRTFVQNLASHLFGPQPIKPALLHCRYNPATDVSDITIRRSDGTCLDLNAFLSRGEARELAKLIGETE